MTKLIPKPPERAWLDVDLAALTRNARRFQELLKVPLLPMVKANGYGLGALAVTRALEEVVPWGYGVATAAEGAELRKGGITRPIVVFTPLLPNADSVAELQATGLRPVIGDLAALTAWVAGGGGPFHLEIDTGMSRCGFRWHDGEAIEELRARLPNLPDWEGVFTHFHSADTDRESSLEQLKRFEAVLQGLGLRPPLVHFSNSAAAGLTLEASADLSRPGIFLYGGRAGSLEPEPVARLQARVVGLRRLRPGDTVSYGAEACVKSETTIATLSIGYADGVPRALGSRGLVELGGVSVPIVGRVTMDMLMVDVEDTPVAVGDVATLFGGLVSLDEQAALAGTVSYELLTSLSARVERHYQDS
ncbi:MAG TPA: alanine racemase [Gemmatimonadales bacterium]|nr:alanine racemase [Gemmatimonadales bacterium]